MTVILSQQVGTEGKRRTCSATCHRATKDKCACICGGRYHGIARGKTGPKNVEEADAMRTKEGTVMDKLEQVEKDST